jgi:hypothetical protein
MKAWTWAEEANAENMSHPVGDILVLGDVLRPRSE